MNLVPAARASHAPLRWNTARPVAATKVTGLWRDGGGGRWTIERGVTRPVEWRLRGRHSAGGTPVDQFLQRHAKDVIGVLSGFDRVVFRGTIRHLAHVQGMMGYLSHVSVLLKQFAQHVEAMSERLKKAATEGMQASGRPVVYLPSAMVSKEEEAK